jgi:hypothetical protein
MPCEDHFGEMCAVIEGRSWLKMMSCFEAHHLFFMPIVSLIALSVCDPPVTQALNSSSTSSTALDCGEVYGSWAACKAGAV